MSKPTVKERLKAVQRRIGVNDDGVLGPITLSRIEGILDQVFGPDVQTPEHSLVVSRKSLDQIVQFEISSDAYYRRVLTRPTWPKGRSGITIGIGYDLGYHPKTQIRKDWKGKVSDEDLEKLVAVVGLRGEAAHEALPTVRHIKISLEAAKTVYYTVTLIKYAALTLKAYPGVDELPADAQGGLLSLVFNRGAAMSGGRRREMKAIQPLVVAKDLNGIAEQIRAMKRLWKKSVLRGLHIRRDKEAQLIAEARLEYDPSELVLV